MIEDSGLKNKILAMIKGLAPQFLMQKLRPTYHYFLSATSAWFYGYPSRKLKVIAITGTKGKSTTTYMMYRVLLGLGEKVSAIGSLGYFINDKSWPNNLKMTMPGRGKIHKFMKEALDAGCDWCILETTSEGIEQFRLVGIDVDCAVFTNLHPEHIESHGSMENYKKAKLKLFAQTKNIHILNYEDPYFADFANFGPRQTITFGLKSGMFKINDVSNLNLKIKGDFNTRNALGVLAVCSTYGLDINSVAEVLNSITEIPGRMQLFHLKSGALAIVDYAHTPDSLELVYKTARDMLKDGGRLTVVLGSAGGGRDIWKRPVFGSIAQKYPDEIILTNEDPFDEDPQDIVNQIKKGFVDNVAVHAHVIIDRREAIEKSCLQARAGDVVVITGKGSEVSMALAGGVKIPWSDADIVMAYCE